MARYSTLGTKWEFSQRRCTLIFQSSLTAVDVAMKILIFALKKLDGQNLSFNIIVGL